MCSCGENRFAQRREGLGNVGAGGGQRMKRQETEQSQVFYNVP
jgi:hypothetical protein